MNVKPRNYFPRMPWLTSMLAGACLLVFLYTPLSHIAVYDRQLILSGEVWRMLSGHLVHFSTGHLAFNLLFLLIAGTILENRNARIFRWLTLGSALAISAYLWIFAPQYAQYGGLSGVLSAYLVYFSCGKILSEKGKAWPWIILLLLFTGKIIFELSQGAPFFVSSADFHVATSVHVIGALVGVVFVAFDRGRKTHPLSPVYPRG